MARRPRFWIAVLIQLAALGAWPQTIQPQSLQIYVYNQAGVSAQVLSEAEERTTRIFRLSGLHAVWVDCETAEIAGTNCTGLPQPGDVIVQIVHETRNLNGDVFGAAFLGRNGAGQYTDVYYNRITELHRDWKTPLSNVLGHVMAHEVGHLLLGLNSHSISGIMRGYWESGELRAAERGQLLFSSEQAKLMRERSMPTTADRNPRNTLAASVRTAVVIKP